MGKNTNMALPIVGISFIGIVLAFIEKILYDEGIFIDEFISGSITLPDLMTVTIIIFMLIAVIVGVSNR